MTDKNLPEPASDDQVRSFLERVRRLPPARADAAGRLIFALDATASRQPTWDRASALQAHMFDEAASLGGLTLQLAWYRGFNEFRASDWVTRSDPLVRQMTAVTCAAGLTQIGRVLAHAQNESRTHRIAALAFVGDCVEEPAGPLEILAGQLGVLGLPAFMFQEGDDPEAGSVFAAVARLSGGAHCRFDSASAEQLKQLLRGVAAYASGGRKALEDLGRRQGGAVLQLARQVGRH